MLYFPSSLAENAPYKITEFSAITTTIEGENAELSDSINEIFDGMFDNVPTITQPILSQSEGTPPPNLILPTTDPTPIKPHPQSPTDVQRESSNGNTSTGEDAEEASEDISGLPSFTTIRKESTKNLAKTEDLAKTKEISANVDQSSFLAEGVERKPKQGHTWWDRLLDQLEFDLGGYLDTISDWEITEPMSQ